jgi:hypothetical protein
VRSLNLFFFYLSNDFSIYAFRARSGSLKIGLAELKVAQKTASWFYFLVRNLSLSLSLSLSNDFSYMLLGPDLVALNIGLASSKFLRKWLPGFIL